MNTPFSPYLHVNWAGTFGNFNSYHSHMYETVSHCRFVLHFPVSGDVEQPGTFVGHLDFPFLSFGVFFF